MKVSCWSKKIICMTNTNTFVLLDSFQRGTRTFNFPQFILSCTKRPRTWLGMLCIDQQNPWSTRSRRKVFLFKEPSVKLDLGDQVLFCQKDALLSNNPCGSLTCGNTSQELLLLFHPGKLTIPLNIVAALSKNGQKCISVCYHDEISKNSKLMRRLSSANAAPGVRFHASSRLHSFSSY